MAESIPSAAISYLLSIQMWKLLTVMLMMSITTVLAARVKPHHDIFLNSAYRASWSPNFSGWNRLGGSNAYASSWMPNFSGWGRNNAYAASWSPNFSGWGRRSYWKHNSEAQPNHDSLPTSVDPTWHPNFSGFRRTFTPTTPTIWNRSVSYVRPASAIIRRSYVTPGLTSFSGLRRSTIGGYDPTWQPNFSGFRRTYPAYDATWNPNFSGFRRLLY